MSFDYIFPNNSEHKKQEHYTITNKETVSIKIIEKPKQTQLEIPVLPFSFEEFCQADAGKYGIDRLTAFRRYTQLGGMPFIRPEYSEDQIFQRLDEIVSDIILKDICNRKRGVDTEKIGKILNFLYSEQ